MLEPIPDAFWVGGGVHPEQVTNLLPTTDQQPFTLIVN